MIISHCECSFDIHFDTYESDRYPIPKSIRFNIMLVHPFPYTPVAMKMFGIPECSDITGWLNTFGIIGHILYRQNYRVTPFNL